MIIFVRAQNNHYYLMWLIFVLSYEKFFFLFFLLFKIFLYQGKKTVKIFLFVKKHIGRPLAGHHN